LIWIEVSAETRKTANPPAAILRAIIGRDLAVAPDQDFAGIIDQGLQSKLESRK